MKSKQELMGHIGELHKRSLECKQRRLEYEAKGDSFMVNLWLMETQKVLGQIEALKWVLGVK